MSLLSWVNDEVKKAGGLVGDRWRSPPDASTLQSAAPTAPTTPVAKPDEAPLSSVIGDFGRGAQQEGLGALLDPFGAIDRQKAQHELAARFNVVAPDTAGNQNTVTQEQFQQIARQYSDIGMGRSDLQIATPGMDTQKAAEFKQGTMNDLASLMQTRSGRALIADLQTARNTDGSHRTTEISPLSDADFADHGGSGGTYVEQSGSVVRKTGFVEYRPGQVSLPGNADARSDVALMHELTHANASIHDKFAKGNVTSADHATQADIAGAVSRSEYQAVGLGSFASTDYNENAYRRDRAAIGASGSGIRNDQGHSDVKMPQRTTYMYPSGAAGSRSQLAGSGQ